MISDEQLLVSSAGQGKAAVVAHIISRGVNINCVDTLGRTALHAALLQGHLDVVKLLLDHGANPNMKRRDGWSPLEIAERRSNSRELIALLMAAGAQAKGGIAMAVCDAHGAIWKSEKHMSPGVGYLLGARFVQRSVIQDKLLDRDMPIMRAMGITREQYRLHVESMQGASPWLICDECIGVLNLSQADKDAARQAARRFAVENTTSGHVPGTLADKPPQEILPAQKAAGHVPHRETPTIGTERRIFNGKSAQEAKEAAKAEVPEDQIISLDVRRDVKEHTAQAEGRSSIEAIEQAKARVPSTAFEVGEVEIIREGRSGVVEITAYSEDEARASWKSSAPKRASLENLACSLTPKKGFLGLGKAKGTWKAHWSLSYIAKVSFKKPAEVTVRFKAKK